MKLTSVLTLLTGIITVTAEKNVNKSESDLVSRKDLWKYVTAVDKILNYCSENKFQVDMNMYHGLFLMKVFLNRYWNKPLKNLPLPLRNKLNSLMRKQQYLSKHFDTKVNEDRRPSDKANKRIYTLMNYEAPWVSNLKNFQTNAWDEPVPSDKKLEELYSIFNVYSKYVMDVFNVKNKNTTLFPMLVARCLENIANNPRTQMLQPTNQQMNDTNVSKNCTSSEACKYLIQNEVDFGYIMTHKLMVLQNAHYGRGCYIYSKVLDDELVKRYCQAMYAEAVYIGKHDTSSLLTDLHMEQITLCGLEGYADFLKTSWISTILMLQDKSGCIKFSHGTERASEMKNSSKDSSDLKNIDGKAEEWEIVKVSKLKAMEEFPCNVHTTGLAMGTLGLAIRYILDSLDVLDVAEIAKQNNTTKSIVANKKHKIKHI